VGDLDGALEAYGQALARDLQSAKGYLNRGAVLQDKHDLKGAHDAYARGLELDPQSAVAHNNLGSLFLKDDLPGAEKEFRGAVARKSDFPLAWSNLGMVLGKQKRYPAAAAAYRQAILLEPKNHRPHLDLGRLYQDQGEATAALAEFETARALRPDLMESYNNI